MSLYDENPAFWTEARCIEHRANLLNVLMHPEQFPKANHNKLWRDIEDLESYMISHHATVATMRALCGEG